MFKSGDKLLNCWWCLFGSCRKSFLNVIVIISLNVYNCFTTSWLILVLESFRFQEIDLLLVSSFLPTLSSGRWSFLWHWNCFSLNLKLVTVWILLVTHLLDVWCSSSRQVCSRSTRHRLLFSSPGALLSWRQRPSLPMSSCYSGLLCLLYLFLLFLAEIFSGLIDEFKCVRVIKI